MLIIVKKLKKNLPIKTNNNKTNNNETIINPNLNAICKCFM